MKQKTNKGITLIALVITIIVMLILVAVTISMAVNGGLFSYAGKATQDTNNAYASEQNLGSGAVTIDGKNYASIDDYLEGNLIFDASSLVIGEAINADHYGYKCVGYTGYSDSYDGDWRLFYQDICYTYLITDEVIYRLNESDYSSYLDGSYISEVGRQLNLGWYTYSGSENSPVVRCSAYLLDTSLWSIFGNDDSVFAIATPTESLLAASFRATDHDGGVYYAQRALRTNACHGIYNKSLNTDWYLATPVVWDGSPFMYYVEGGLGQLHACWDFRPLGVRPVVAIPTPTFLEKYTLVDDPYPLQPEPPEVADDNDN